MPSHESDRGIEPGVEIRHTTILSVRHEGRVVIAGDGQVSVGQTIMKSKAKKAGRTAAILTGVSEKSRLLIMGDVMLSASR